MFIVFAAVPWDRPSRQSPFPIIRPGVTLSDESSSWVPAVVKEGQSPTSAHTQKKNGLREGMFMCLFIKSGLKCFSCEGKDSGRCLRYFEAEDTATCRANEYCAVTRTEQNGIESLYGHHYVRLFSSFFNDLG